MKKPSKKRLKSKSNSTPSPISDFIFPIKFDLPSELLTEILARLPAKTLVKFTCVCKEWRSLIENPSFASLHMNLSKINRENDTLFLVEFSRSTILRTLLSSTVSVTSYSSLFQRTSRVKPPDCFRNGWVGAYTNGLLLGRMNDLKPNGSVISYFVVWNPSIRKSIKITPPTPKLFIWVGLGFDPKTNDTKVVFIDSPWKPWELGLASFQISAYIYSINADTWKCSKFDTHFLKYPLIRDPAVFLNGAIHWIGCDVNPPYNDYVIAFDVQNEAFNYFRLPDLTREGGRRSAEERLCVVGESLVFLDCCYFPLRITVWVMRQYGVAESWVKQRVVVGDSKFEGEHLRRNGEIVLFARGENNVKSYNIETEEMKDLGGRILRDNLVYVDDYTESLVLLNRNHQELN